MTMPEVEPIEIRASDKASMDRCITAAVDGMIESVKRRGTRGILVTRLGDGHVVVTLSKTVPFGHTYQLDVRRRLPHGPADLFPPFKTVDPEMSSGRHP